MTREDVIRIAREAGFDCLLPSEHIDDAGGVYVGDDDISGTLARFAALVAAAEQDRILLAAYQVAMYQVAAEREACAEICDRLERRYGNGPDVEHWAQGFKKGASVSAAKIRERGKE